MVDTGTSWLTHFHTLGGDCTDSVYRAIALDGRTTCPLTGRFGDLRLILPQVHNEAMGRSDSRL